MTGLPAYPPDVLLPSHQIKVVRPEAPPVPTQMVDLHPVRDGADPYRVGKTMREHLTLGVVRPRHAVAAVDVAGGPFPTSGGGDSAVVQEPLLVGEGAFEVLRYRVHTVALMKRTHATGTDLARTPLDRAWTISRLACLNRCRVRICSAPDHSDVRCAETSGVRSLAALRNRTQSHSTHGQYITRKVRSHA